MSYSYDLDVWFIYGCQFIVLVVFIPNDQTSKRISPFSKIYER